MGVIRSRTRRRDRSEKGASLTELALILPVLITTVFGCIDFGRFAYTHIAVTNAAREGAAVGSSNSFTKDRRPAWDAQIKDAVVAEMQGVPGFDESKLEVPPALMTVESDGRRRVRVSVRYPFETVVSWPLIPNNVTLRQDVEMPSIR